MQLSTGLVIAGGYADKVKKAMFAQLREEISRGGVDQREVAKATAELNRLLYKVIVDKLKSDKGDVVRARVDYDVVDGKIELKLGSLKVEYFKRVPDEEVAKIVEEAVAEYEREREAAFEVEEVATTAIGDRLFRVLLMGREVGVIVATPLDDGTVLRGSLLEPRPVILRGRLPVSENLEEALRRQLPSLVAASKEVSVKEASSAVEKLKALASS
ncbi:MAG: DUF2258 domain-containing protein [Candidatus Nezhaarchaeota archaeon]|nr:DUF2258 domain-containing protein [Candidatus Nezhaarchaeota archaeon]